MDTDSTCLDLETVVLALGTGRRLVSDPFFAPGDLACNALRKLGVFDIDDEKLCHDVVASFPCSVPGCTLTFDSVFEFDQHYNSVHRYFCCQCKKRLPTPHLLDLHLSETHDSFFLAQTERKPMYACYIEECTLKFANPQERRDHCIAAHKFPHNFRFDFTGHRKPTKQPTAKKKNPNPPRPKPMNVDASLDGTPAESDTTMETNEVAASKVEKPVKFKPFSFGRGGRGGKAGRGNWFQGAKPSGTQTSTLTTTLVEDMLASLPDLPEPMA